MDLHCSQVSATSESLSYSINSGETNIPPTSFTNIETNILDPNSRYSIYFGGTNVSVADKMSYSRNQFTGPLFQICRLLRYCQPLQLNRFLVSWNKNHDDSHHAVLTNIMLNWPISNMTNIELSHINPHSFKYGFDVQTKPKF